MDPDSSEPDIPLGRYQQSRGEDERASNHDHTNPPPTDLERARSVWFRYPQFDKRSVLRQ